MKTLRKYLVITRTCSKRFVLMFLLFWLMVPCGIISQPIYNRKYIIDDGIFGIDTYEISGVVKNCSETMKPNATNYDSSTIIYSLDRSAIYNTAFITGCLCAGIYSDLRGAKNVYYLYVSIYVLMGFAGLTVVKAQIKSLHFVLIFFLGIANGVELPARASLISQWISTGYLGTTFILLDVTNSGLTHVVNHALRSKVYSHSNMQHYILASTYLVWLILFHFNVYSSPRLHPYCTEKERNRMQKYLSAKFPKYIPIKKILLEYRIWTLGICKIVYNLWIIGYGVCCIFFFKVVMSMPMAQLIGITGGLLLQRHVLMVALATLTDYVMRKWYISVMYLRTLLIAIGLIVPSIVKVYITYTECNLKFADTLFAVAIVFEAILHSNIYPNALDITRNFIGTAVAIIASCEGLFRIASNIIAPHMFTKYDITEFRNRMGLITIISTSTAFLHYNFTKPKAASWDRVLRRQQVDEEDVHQQAGITLANFDEVFTRIFTYARTLINRLRQRRVQKSKKESNLPVGDEGEYQTDQGDATSKYDY